jgi:hypothetical protein
MASDDGGKQIAHALKVMLRVQAELLDIPA